MTGCFPGLLSILLVPVVCLLLTGACQSKEPEKFSTALAEDAFTPAASGQLPGVLAIAPTPRNFPHHTPDDVHDMIDQAAQLGSAAVFIYQWGDEHLFDVARHVIPMAREKRLTPVIGLSPTSLDSGRKNLDVPSDLRGGVFSRPSFGKEAVRDAFVTAARKLAEFKPTYLCLATEINLLALQRMDEFLKFVPVYKAAYRAVKDVSPNTKVFVSFQYEFVRIVDNKEPGKIRDHAKLIDIFRPELDLVAITSYPCEYYESPAKMPSNYYAYFNRYLQKGDRVMVMEIGWPSSGCGSPDEQTQFINRLPALLSPISPVLTAWALLHDVKLAQFGDNLATSGILTREGKRKEGWNALRSIAARSATRPARCADTLASRALNPPLLRFPQWTITSTKRERAMIAAVIRSRFVLAFSISRPLIGEPLY